MITTFFFSFYFIFSMGLILLSFEPLGALWRTLKMQNEPKSQLGKISVTSSCLKTKDYGRKTAQAKNEPKQTQISNDTHQHKSPKSQRRDKATTWRYNKRFGRRPLLIFDICDLIFDMLFMTNEPNFNLRKNTVSDFLKNTNDDSLKTDDHKNEPKRTQSVEQIKLFSRLVFC